MSHYLEVMGIHEHMWRQLCAILDKTEDPILRGLESVDDVFSCRLLTALLRPEEKDCERIARAVAIAPVKVFHIDSPPTGHAELPPEKIDAAYRSLVAGFLESLRRPRAGHFHSAELRTDENGLRATLRIESGNAASNIGFSAEGDLPRLSRKINAAEFRGLSLALGAEIQDKEKMH